jgi:hypothetical protein
MTLTAKDEASYDVRGTGARLHWPEAKWCLSCFPAASFSLYMATVDPVEITHEQNFGERQVAVDLDLQLVLSHLVRRGLKRKR